MPYQDQSGGDGQIAQPPKRLVQFGSFEFRPDTQELRKNGIRIKVQAKPLQILRALIDNPGELVTREALCRELWPDGTFVDFESGLNTATNRLRAALNDSADHPRYVETLPRLGYRFICPVREMGTPSRTESASPIATSPAPQQPTVTPDPPPIPENPQKPSFAFVRRNTVYMLLLLFASVMLILLTARFNSAKAARPAHPVFHPVTYRPEVIQSARFLPGEKSAVYSTFSQHDGTRTLSSKLDRTNLQATLVAAGMLASVSRLGDLAVLIRHTDQKDPQISDVSMAGQESHVIAENARTADWLPNGYTLALVRTSGVESAIEFPARKTVYRCNGWITDLRVSPAGNQVAFIEHPFRDDDRGHIRLLDKNGKTRELTADWGSAAGLAWSRAGREVWFTASKTGLARSLYAVSTTGELRQISNTPSSLRLFDIAADGRLLLSVEDLRGSMLARFPGAQSETDVTQFDESSIDAMSSNGERLLFTEAGDAGGQHYETFIFDNIQHSSRSIGMGRGMALSPDGRFALMLDPVDNTHLMLVPVEGGSSSCIFGHGLHYQWARFLSNGVILAGASYPAGPLMLYTQSLDGSAPTVVKDVPYLDWAAVAPDGSKVVGLAGKDAVMVNFRDKNVLPLPVKGVVVPVAWSVDGRFVFLVSISGTSPSLLKLDIGSNSVETWKTLQIPPYSFSGLAGIAAAPDAGAYAYSIHQDLARLYVVDGWS